MLNELRQHAVILCELDRDEVRLEHRVVQMVLVGLVGDDRLQKLHEAATEYLLATLEARPQREFVGGGRRPGVTGRLGLLRWLCHGDLSCVSGGRLIAGGSMTFTPSSGGQLQITRVGAR